MRLNGRHSGERPRRPPPGVLQKTPDGQGEHDSITRRICAFSASLRGRSPRRRRWFRSAGPPGLLPIRPFHILSEQGLNKEGPSSLTPSETAY
jgi:hypothetical protein